MAGIPLTDEAPGGSSLGWLIRTRPRHLEKIDGRPTSEPKGDCLVFITHASCHILHSWLNRRLRYQGVSGYFLLLRASFSLCLAFFFYSGCLSCVLSFFASCRQFPVLQNSFSALACFSYSIRHAHLIHSYPRTLSLILLRACACLIINFQARTYCVLLLFGIALLLSYPSADSLA